MRQRTGRYAIFEQFIADGIKYVFGNPGTVEQGFLDVFTDISEVQYILALHESVAVATADGYARATQKPAIIQLHSGVGLGNGVGMLYQAMRGHTPLVVVTSDAGVCYDAMDAQMACDLIGMAKPVTKCALRVTDPTSLLRTLRRAIKTAATPPMGPVFLNLPMDVLDAPNNEDVVPTSIINTKVSPSHEVVKQLAGILVTADKPIMIIGDGIAASGAQKELAHVAELVGAEVWGANNSEVNINATLPQYKGLLGHMFGMDSAAVTRQADVVLIIGTYVFPEVFPYLSDVFNKGAIILHVDLDTYEIAKNFPVEMGIMADPKQTLGLLAEVLPHLMTPTQKKEAARRNLIMAKEKEERREAQDQENQKNWDRIPMLPARFMKEFSQYVDKNTVIFDEALTCSSELNFYNLPQEPGQFFQTRGGSLGVGIPGAIGLKLAFPDKTVVGFTGDGGSMYTIQALWSAAHHNIGAKFIICNNHSYKLLKLNILQYWKERDIPEHEFPAMFDVDHPSIDFCKIAQSFGIPAMKVEKPEDIKRALDAAFSDNGSFLIDLILASDVAPSKRVCTCGQ